MACRLAACDGIAVPRAWPAARRMMARLPARPMMAGDRRASAAASMDRSGGDAMRRRDGLARAQPTS
ncbi:hypothetical protein CKO45_12920 [Paracraurococcus ruber]|uniref:Uncharacterized protein n=1 Tax=Paracraurococcus ruber TaxID=77675 RepID=A0ABS1CY47_9PROT|nr:hypothetical protein [Paracraurococcus ruber]